MAASIAAEENEGLGMGASTSGAPGNEVFDEDDDEDEEMILVSVIHEHIRVIIIYEVVWLTISRIVTFFHGIFFYHMFLQPEMHGKVDPAVLAALPPSMQLDLLVQVAFIFLLLISCYTCQVLINHKYFTSYAKLLLTDERETHG